MVFGWLSTYSLSWKMIYDQGKEFVGYYFSILKIIEEKEYQLQ